MMTVPTYDERPSEQSRDQETSSPKWTVLVYQAGDNNLSEECVYALKEMKKVGTEVLMRGEGEADPLLNVVVQFDPSGHGNPTRRFKIRAPGGDGTLEHDELKRKRKPETDTGDAETLLDFLCESIEENPTTYYMVVLAGHGAGIREGFFLQDDERPLSSIPNSFPIPMLKEVFHSDRLKKALGADRKINILGLDACAMSMVEVCYELRGTKTLELLAASEGFSLNAGWPFDRIIEHIRDNPNIGPDDLAEFIVKQYVRYYHDYFLGGASVDQSIIVLEKVEDLKQSIDHLANTLIDEFEKESPKPDEGYDEKGKPFQDAILLAHWAAQSYNGEQCIDLYDFCTLLQKRYPPKESDGEKSVWFACERVKKILGDPASQTINSGANQFIRKSCYSGAAFQYSFGASLYFPWGELDFAPSYTLLDFARYSDWPRFLELYLKKTKRQERERPKRFRATPPTDRGPGGKIFSMRNPPTTFGLSKCIKQRDGDVEVE